MAKNELAFLLKHSSVYGIGSILAKIVAFILLPLYTQHLSLADYGVMELLDIILTLIGFVLSINLATAIQRFYFESDDENKRKSVVGTIFTVLSFSAIFGWFILYFASDFLSYWLLGSYEYQEHFTIAISYAIAGLFIDVALKYLIVLQRSYFFLAFSMINLAVNVIFTIYFVVFLQYGVLGVLYANLINKLMIGLPLVFWVWRRVGWHWNWSLLKEMLSYSAPLVPSFFLHVLIYNSDRYFINYFMTLSATGLYGISQKLGTALHILITSPFLISFMPRRFEIVKRDTAKKEFQNIYHYYMLLIISATLGLNLFTYLVVLLLAPEFQEVADYIPLISLTMIVLGMKYHLDFGIFYSKKTQYVIVINLIVVIVRFLLNFLLIPLWGLWGAAIASLVSTIVMAITTYYIARRYYSVNFQFWDTAIILTIAIAVFFLGLVDLGNIFMNIAYDTVLLLLVFPALLVVFKVLTIEELRQTREYLKSVVGR